MKCMKVQTIMSWDVAWMYLQLQHFSQFREVGSSRLAQWRKTLEYQTQFWLQVWSAIRLRLSAAWFYLFKVKLKLAEIEILLLYIFFFVWKLIELRVSPVQWLRGHLLIRDTRTPQLSGYSSELTELLACRNDVVGTIQLGIGFRTLIIRLNEMVHGSNTNSHNYTIQRNQQIIQMSLP